MVPPMEGVDLGGLGRDGYVLLPGFLDAGDLSGALEELSLMYPSATEFHDRVDRGVRSRFEDGQFGGIDNLPFESLAWNLLAVHPRIVDVARRALGSDSIRLYQAEAWAKFSSATDYEQLHHRDFTNHTILVPTDDERYGHVEMFLYLNGVDLDTGPTFAVSQRLTRDMPALPARVSREEAPELYSNEVAIAGPPGTLLVYLPSTFHRGGAMRRPRAARYTIHLNFRTEAAEWVNRRGWGEWANHKGWTRFVERLSPDQLTLFGFPPPGHPYWTPTTLDGVQLRYPELDMTPWRQASGDDTMAL